MHDDTGRLASEFADIFGTREEADRLLDKKYVLGVKETMWQTAEITRPSRLDNRNQELHDRMLEIQIAGSACPGTFSVQLDTLLFESKVVLYLSSDDGFMRLTA